jgi:hypothetical protein
MGERSGAGEFWGFGEDARLRPKLSWGKRKREPASESTGWQLRGITGGARKPTEEQWICNKAVRT